jgi:mono/diheme cytochrome c family protein
LTSNGFCAEPICAFNFISEVGDIQGIKEDYVKLLWSVVIFLSATQVFAQSPSQKEGRRIFQQKCAVCHVPAWVGATALGPPLSNELVKGNPANESAARDAITNGLYDEQDKMPGFKYTLTSEQIQNVIDYLKTLDQPPQTVSSPRPER